MNLNPIDHYGDDLVKQVKKKIKRALDRTDRHVYDPNQNRKVNQRKFKPVTKKKFGFGNEKPKGPTIDQHREKPTSAQHYIKRPIGVGRRGRRLLWEGPEADREFPTTAKKTMPGRKEDPSTIPPAKPAGRQKGRDTDPGGVPFEPTSKPKKPDSGDGSEIPEPPENPPSGGGGGGGGSGGGGSGGGGAKKHDGMKKHSKEDEIRNLSKNVQNMFEIERITRRDLSAEFDPMKTTNQLVLQQQANALYYHELNRLNTRFG
jgi:hypothetical protein